MGVFTDIRSSVLLVGGAANPAEVPGSLASQNFVGCLKGVSTDGEVDSVGSHGMRIPAAAHTCGSAYLRQRIPAAAHTYGSAYLRQAAEMLLRQT